MAEEEVELIDIELAQMLTPGNYHVRELPGPNCSKETKDFSVLQAKMMCYFESDGPKVVVPREGQVYGAKVDDTWQRVEVQNVFQRTGGPQAQCKLLDFGTENIHIPSRYFRVLPKEFHQLPYRHAMNCVLYGIDPVSLVTNPLDMITKLQPCATWDISSNIFMNKLIKEVKNWKMFVVSRSTGAPVSGSTGALVSGSSFDYLIRLFASGDSIDKQVCINDLLISKKFAAYAAISDGGSINNVPTSSVGSKKGNDEFLRLTTVTDCGPRDCLSDPLDAIESRANSRLSTPCTTVTIPESPSKKPPTFIGKGRGAFIRNRILGGSTLRPGESELTRKLSQSNCAYSAELTRSDSARHLEDTKPASAIPQRMLNGSGTTQQNGSCKSSGSEIESTATSSDNMSTDEVTIFPHPMSEDSSTQKFIRGFKASRPQVVETEVQPDMSTLLRRESHDESDSSANLCRFIAKPKVKFTSQYTGSEVPTTDELGMLIDGYILRQCITDISGQPFASLIMNTPCLQGIRHPSNLQCFLWPAVVGGVDVVAVAPKSGGSKHSVGGKTLSYLLPLASELAILETYQSLPKCSIGPFVIILCASWFHVSAVYDQCVDIFKQQKLHVLRLYGGGDEDRQQCRLINGCEVLVATPGSLMRAIDKQYTLLNRLSHLVLEDADVLTQRHGKSLEEFMAEYCKELKDRVLARVTAPQQILVFSPRWVPGIKQFAERYLNSPAYVIASKTEAAYYGRVKHVVILCKKQDRLKHILDRLVSRTGKVAIFVMNDADAKHVYEVLQSGCLTSLLLLGNADLLSDDLANINKEWNRVHSPDSQPILVLTDRELGEFTIRDASWVIHYDIPTDQKTFTERLWTMRSQFTMMTNDTSKASREQDDSASFLLVTEECKTVASKLVRVLERSGQDVPVQLQEMADVHTELTERKKPNRLCHYMKSFGKCRKLTNCFERHKICTSLDTPGISPKFIHLPTEGTIKVKVTLVCEVSRYYVRLLEHRDMSGTVNVLSSEGQELAANMGLYYGHLDCRTPVSREIKVEDRPLFAWSSGHEPRVFHRVELLNFFSNSSDPDDPLDRALVHFVDDGKEDKVAISDLCELPNYFAEVPYQAVEVYICRVQPIDMDDEWTERATLFIAEKIQNKELTGHIVLSMANTLWLDPLIEREYLPKLNIWNERLSVRALLLEKNFVLENSEHMELLYAACEGVLMLPALMSYKNGSNRGFSRHGQMFTTKTEVLPDIETDIVVSAIESIDLIYVQLEKNIEELTQFIDTINRHVLIEQSKRTTYEAKEGLLVLAKQPIDDKWNRGKVMSVVRDQLDIFFVDSGIMELIPQVNVIPMPLRFIHFPFQAIECSLVDIEPIDGDSKDRVIDELFRLAGDELNPNVFQSIIVRKSEARVTGDFRYGIVLRDIRSFHYDINISSELVKGGCAKLSSTKLQNMFPLASMDDDDDIPYHRLSSLCKRLLETQDEAIWHDTAQELQHFTVGISKTDGDRSGLVHLICLTLSYTGELATTQALLCGLKLLTENNPKHCDEMEMRRHWDVICYILDQSDRNGLIDEILYTLESIVTCPRCCVNLIVYGALVSFGSILANASTQYVLRTSASILRTVLSAAETSDYDTNSFRTAVGLIECLNAAVGKLTSDDPQATVDCLHSVTILVTNNCVKMVHMRDCNAITILCHCLDTGTNDSMLESGVNILRLLASQNRFNKDVMVELNVHGTIDNLLNRPMLSDNVNVVCSALKKLLHVSIHKRLTDRNHGNESHFHSNHVNEPLAGFNHINERLNGSNHDSENLPDGCVYDASLRPPLRRPPTAVKQSLQNRPISSTDQVTLEALISPYVYWFQSHWNLLLRVDIKDASVSTDIVHFSEDKLQFSVVVMSSMYAFNLDLYELIVPEKCKILVQTGCIYIGLKKKEMSHWPRVTHLRNGYANLKSDWGRCDVGSSGSDEDEDNNKRHQGDQAASPLSLIKRNVLDSRPFEAGVPSSNKGVVALPDSEYSSTESERHTSQDDCDPEFDPRTREDRACGYHVM